MLRGQIQVQRFTPEMNVVRVTGCAELLGRSEDGNLCQTDFTQKFSLERTFDTTFD